MRVTDQALFHDTDVLAVDEDRLVELKRRALTAPHRRYRLCLHRSSDDPVQEMIIVHCRDNYSRPHAHETASCCVVLDGALGVYVFDESGSVARVVELAARGSGKPFTLWIGPGQWHMPVCRTPQVVFYETMAGPFRRDEANRWAPWSPEEGDADAIARYLAGLGVAR